MIDLEAKPSIYNKEKKPLEELKFQLGEGKSRVLVPALSHQFSSCRFMVPYYSPPKLNVNGQFVMGAKEEWMNQTNLFIEDTKWLLGLKHYRFWSQVVFQKPSLDGLISFLQEAYPHFNMDFIPNDESIKQQYNVIAHLIYALILRLSSRVESKFEWIGERKYAEIVYNNFIISLPIMLDMCSLYGKSNATTIKKIINDIFAIQPAYMEDLRKCIREVKSVFHSLEERLTGGTTSSEAIKLSDLNIHKNGLTQEAIEDMLLYILDISVTLTTFVDFFPPGAICIHESQLETQIAALYEILMNVTQNHLRRFTNEESLFEALFSCNKRFNLTRFYLIELYRESISVSLNKVVENRSVMTQEEIKSISDNFITILADSVTEKCFINDYSKKYPIKRDLELLFDICPEIDSVKYQYILEFISSQEYSKEKKGSGQLVQQSMKYQSSASHDLLEPKGNSEIRGMQLQSLVTEVKDVLPHLGDGFIELCLKYFNFTSSSVIDAVLENNLPEHLLSLDPELPIIPPEPGTANRPLAVMDRINVFDNDEFDIMTRDYVDQSKIHRGKRKEKHKDLKEMLDDKTHVEELREMFSKFSNVEYEDANYDDEYDDTYDSVDVSVGEAGETEKKHETNIERAQRPNFERNVREEEQDDEAEGEIEGRSQTKFEAFVENPEVVRQRYEERRLSKERFHNSRDVSGKPKGQGQEKDVLFNRHKKSVFKSSQANHNRRRQAQFKKNQGMFPT